MHELSIAVSLLESAEAEAARLGHSRVLNIHVRLGPLSGVVKEALLSAYEIARTESPLAEARLVIEDVPLVIHCPACRAERDAVSVQLLCCAVCGTPASQVLRGRELDIVALEIP